MKRRAEDKTDESIKILMILEKELPDSLKELATRWKDSEDIDIMAILEEAKKKDKAGEEEEAEKAEEEVDTTGMTDE